MTHEAAPRVVLITGGAGGIGLATARRFARGEAKVVLVDARPDAVNDAAETLRAEGHRVVAGQCDVSDPTQVEALVAATIAREGRIDVLVNNAGIMGRVAPIWELSLEEWEHVLAVDLTSVFLVSRAVVPQMRAQRRGAIVSVASIAGKEGTPNLVPYSVAKAGIIAFTKALGKEVVGDGIRVNCVAPGVVATPLLDQLSADATRIMLSKAPMGRFGTADEVAAVVQFLASDDASFITSQCFDASGGRATY
jgi:3-oxoacyl-[acyl-carrier protein] reductase